MEVHWTMWHLQKMERAQNSKGWGFKPTLWTNRSWIHISQWFFLIHRPFRLVKQIRSPAPRLIATATIAAPASSKPKRQRWSTRNHSKPRKKVFYGFLWNKKCGYSSILMNFIGTLSDQSPKNSWTSPNWFAMTGYTGIWQIPLSHLQCARNTSIGHPSFSVTLQRWHFWSLAI